MNSLRSKGSIFKFYSYLPLIILLISVLNEFDFNYLNLEYFSFNFPFILIFYFTLKDFRYFDYSLVFIAGLINDTVVGLPLGISSFSYMLICIATSYFRNITIRPNQIKDWFYFLFIISLINSINYSILTLIFSFNLNLVGYMINNFFTFLFYIIFISIFKQYLKTLND
ncbi:MAG: rod shape-determining protein MreD [Flavobacteriaceae bacterium]|nr:rod shape-determining protein MreD [Flavobacteriaceae bacterium]